MQSNGTTKQAHDLFHTVLVAVWRKKAMVCFMAIDHGLEGREF